MWVLEDKPEACKSINHVLFGGFAGEGADVDGGGLSGGGGVHGEYMISDIERVW